MSYLDLYGQIDALASANPDIIKFASGVAEEWIGRAEAALSVRFSPSFVYYLKRYGGATIGGEVINGLIGIEFEEACGPDIVYITLLDQQISRLDPRYVTLVDNDGDELFYLDTAATNEAGESPVVHEFIEDAGCRVIYASSFAEFLLNRIQFCLAGWRAQE